MLAESNMRPHLSSAAVPSEHRSINWIENASNAIGQHSPQLDSHTSMRVGERLGALLLARISPDLARQLLGLLPHGASRDLAALARHADGDPDHSIGYIQFVEAAHNDLGGLSEAEEELERRIADAFLWAMSGDLPAELKADLTRELPAELRSRMNLYSAYSEDQKVA
jgi:hypothetical protein